MQPTKPRQFAAVDGPASKLSAGAEANNPKQAKLRTKERRSIPAAANDAGFSISSSLVAARGSLIATIGMHDPSALRRVYRYPGRIEAAMPRNKANDGLGEMDVEVVANDIPPCVGGGAAQQ